MITSPHLRYMSAHTYRQKALARDIGQTPSKTLAALKQDHLQINHVRM